MNIFSNALINSHTNAVDMQVSLNKKSMLNHNTMYIICLDNVTIMKLAQLVLVLSKKLC